MTARPRIAFDATDASGALVRRWLLELGADPVEASAPDASRLPRAPQHQGVTRSEVVAVVRRVQGRAHEGAGRLDDHGSGERWPRGSW